MSKKFLSAVLSVALLVSAVPATFVSASADETPTADYGLAEKTSDGVILHAFNWSYNTIKENLPAIAEAGYTSVQTSPVQQPKNYGNSKDTAGQWWKLYQPLSFSIAEESWLGTKEELTELCSEAEKYGIKIICDIVSNHMANNESGDSYTYYAGIADYEPQIFSNLEQYFHQLRKNVDDSKIEYIVQGTLDGVPDLNTGDEYVQSRVISLLEECIDCGVDGFRFDAAKHIETPQDGDYASDFWPNVIGTATEYAESKGVELFCYGEVLNTPGRDRDIKAYTEYLNITDNKAGDSTLVNVIKYNPEKVVAAQNYTYDDDHSNYVLWAESHDTYMGESGSAGLSNTADVSEYDIAKAWAIVASRSESQALYLARPNVIMGEAGSSAWRSTAVSEINKFHNKFIGVSDSVYTDGGQVAVQRGDSGIVLVNLGDVPAEEHPTFNFQTQGMADGEYIDAISGLTYTVKDGVLSGEYGSEGILVIYEGAETTPRAKFSKEDTSFKTDTMNLTITLENATSGTIEIDGNVSTFENKTTVTIGEGVEAGKTIAVKVTATDGKKTTTETHYYTKEAGSGTGVFVYFDNSVRNFKDVCVYAFYEQKDDSGNVVYSTSNGNWPGVVMDYNEDTQLYFYELPEDLHVGEARVIFSDGGANQTSQKGHELDTDSMIYQNNKWQNYNPDGVTLIYGDVNGDGKITASDSLVVLRYTIDLEKFTDEQQAQADVDQNDRITSKDSLDILQYVIGNKKDSVIGTEFTFKGSTGGSDTPENPDIPRSGTMFYAVDSVGWIFDYGAKLWLVNNDTKEALEMTKESPDDDNSKYSYIDLPTGWTNLSIYRTDPFATDINGAYNSWNCGAITTGNNAYKMTGDGAGSYTTYDPNQGTQYMPKTIYFDNSKTNWETVCIYGWGSIPSQYVELQKVDGSENLYSYTFDTEIEAGVKTFYFAESEQTSGKKNKRTVDVMGEADKNLFSVTSTNSDRKWQYEWDTIVFDQ